MRRFYMKALLSVVLLAAAAALYGQEAARVVIRETSGTVEVKESSTGDWVPARPGQNVSRSAELSTGFRSTAVLEVGNSVVMVQALTRLTVDEILASSGDERVNINLRVGRVRADVKPPAGGRTEFTVRSPSATASVRGTVFEFDGVRLAVDEGRVHVSGGDRSGTYVGVGHEARVEPVTGRTVSGVERVKEELTPASPAGISNTLEAERLAPPAAGDMELSLNWR
jgi:hypothetical protein